MKLIFSCKLIHYFLHNKHLLHMHWTVLNADIQINQIDYWDYILGCVWLDCPAQKMFLYMRLFYTMSFTLLELSHTFPINICLFNYFIKLKLFFLPHRAWLSTNYTYSQYMHSVHVIFSFSIIVVYFSSRYTWPSYGTSPEINVAATCP
jgi:hypothetical protein